MMLGSWGLWREKEDSSGQRSWDRERAEEGRPLRRARRYDPFLPVSYRFLNRVPARTPPRVATTQTTKGQNEPADDAVASDRLLRINGTGGVISAAGSRTRQESAPSWGAGALGPNE